MKPYYYAAESNSLRKWETIEEAQAEAERYAEKHPGRAFEILRCVGIAQTSTASTFWLDGEEPPEKPRYRLLHNGETIHTDDEYCNTFGEWLSTPASGERLSNMHLRHRRPL